MLFGRFSLLLCLAFVITERQGQAYEKLLLQQIELYKDGQLESIDLSEVNEISWDKLYLFAPYTPVSEVNSVVAGVWIGAWLTDIQYSDRGTLLVFPLNIADFSTIVRQDGYIPEDSLFSFQEKMLK